MRIKISKRNSDVINQLTALYNFKTYGTIARIAFGYSLYLDRKFEIDDNDQAASDGKEWRDDRALLGVSYDDKPYFVIYKALLDQQYGRSLMEDEFVKLFKKHLDFGLERISRELEGINTSSGAHFFFLIKLLKNGLLHLSEGSSFTCEKNDIKEMSAWDSLISIVLGKDEKGNDIVLKLNDLTEFDSCNMAIAGMVGSGKTELVKDILFQIAEQTNKELKFIYFDYKGEADQERIRRFLQLTDTKMVDVKKEPFELNPLGFINMDDQRIRLFNIKSFVDFVCTIATQLGSGQKHILQTIITECFEKHKAVKVNNPALQHHPTLAHVLEVLESYNQQTGRVPDTLDAIITDLAGSIFLSNPLNQEKKIYEQNLYINLPLELSDTLRQLCVFLTLKYLLAVFSSTNDTEPTKDRIKPLRYIIIIDEAHVYLRNRNASKALEDILRQLRSKGVVLIMLTQGVEDFKTKHFDFASQIKIPVCLNINNKDYKLVESFLGTPRSKQKLQETIGKLSPQKAIINVFEPQVITIRQFWNSLSAGR